MVRARLREWAAVASAAACGMMINVPRESWADTNAYRVIAERNAFKLRPPAVASLSTSAPPVRVTNSSTLRLTGVASIDGRKRAFFVQEERGRALEYLSFYEGELRGTIELREVDAEHGEVHLVSNGQELVLSFNSQETAERAARRAEKQFVEEHTRAHEELQRREKERLAREISLNR